MTTMQDMLFQSDQKLDNEHDDTILFADDRLGGDEVTESAPWKIIIADDEEGSSRNDPNGYEEVRI